ncbi:hypothetical protein DPMN_093472 [Dreissena polymorpha]|uniref:Uncharacterized protein n=1 Tax=Dreissena polymorpha TaxID=45954 RepID=A0A9D4R2K7_DREPO|nr:hypothetical protein DPMN_093472 [Dreissena polymorpha]
MRPWLRLESRAFSVLIAISALGRGMGLVVAVEEAVKIAISVFGEIIVVSRQDFQEMFCFYLLLLFLLQILLVLLKLWH